MQMTKWSTPFQSTFDLTMHGDGCNGCKLGLDSFFMNTTFPKIAYGNVKMVIYNDIIS